MFFNIKKAYRIKYYYWVRHINTQKHTNKPILFSKTTNSNKQKKTKKLKSYDLISCFVSC